MSSADAEQERRARFHAIYQNELSYVVHSLRRLGVRERDLEDVAHELFVSVYRQLDEYDRTRPMRPWLFGFAYRTASDYRRLARHRRELVHDRADEAAAPNLPADEAMMAAQQRDLVVSALDALALDQRAVFVMHDIDGHPVTEIASSLGIPLNTAYSRLRLARADFERAVHRLTARRAAR